MLGAIDLNHNSKYIHNKILFRELIHYSVQNFINVCGSDAVKLISNYLKHKEIAFNFGIEFIESQSIPNTMFHENNVLISNGLNPVFNPDKVNWEKFINNQKLCDVQGIQFGTYIIKGNNIKEYEIRSFELEDGITTISDTVVSINEAILKNKDTFDNLPIIINPSYHVHTVENSGKPKVLFSAPYSFFDEELRKNWESKFSITYAYNAPKELVLNLISEVDIWVVSTCPPYFIDDEIYRQGKKLKIVASPSTGTTHMETKYLYENSIELCTIKSSDFIKNIYASSESTLALLLAMVKKMNTTLEQTKFGVWRENEVDNRSIELNGKSIGIVGCGRIGSNLANYSKALGMRVSYYDPNVDLKNSSFKKVGSKDEILREVDIVALCYHLNSETVESFTEQDFKIMKKGAYFLNTARGELIEKGALLKFLENGHLKSAAIDVIRDEAKKNKWNLSLIEYARKNDNLLINPHVAGLTVDSESKAAIEILNEILLVL